MKPSTELIVRLTLWIVVGIAALSGLTMPALMLLVAAFLGIDVLGRDWRYSAPVAGGDRESAESDQVL